MADENVILPSDLFSALEEDLPLEQLLHKRAVESHFQAQIAHQHQTEKQIAAEHRSIWKAPEIESHPPELSYDGRNA